MTSLLILWFCYLGYTIGAREVAVDGVITRTRSGYCKFRDSLPLVASRGLPLGAKGRLYSACVHSVMLYGSETWPVKEEDVIRLERNDAKMVDGCGTVGLSIGFLQNNLGLG